MIILDTNVISEGMLPAPSAPVAAWLDAMAPADLATTTINIAEIRYGLARLSLGRRRQDLEARFAALTARLFETRVFGFDALAAESYGALAARRALLGSPLQGFDGLIAAVAASRGLSVATRDVSGFAECGFDVINPWEDDAM